MSLLDSLLGFQRVFRDGVEIVRRRALDFVGDGWIVQDNPVTGRTEAAVDVDAIAALAAPLAAEQVDESLEDTIEANGILHRVGSGPIVGTALGTHSLLLRGAGNLSAQSVAAGQIIGRPTDGELGAHGLSAFGIQGGTWTPTVSDLSGYSSANVWGAQYVRIGNFVLASVVILCQCSTETWKTLEVTLPVERSGNFSARYQAVGGGGVELPTFDYVAGFVTAVGASQRVRFSVPLSVTNGPAEASFQFSYLLS